MRLKSELQIVMNDLVESGNYIMNDNVIACALLIGACGARMRTIIDSLEDEEDDGLDKKSANDFLSMLKENFEQLKGKK